MHVCVCVCRCVWVCVCVCVCVLLILFLVTRQQHCKRGLWILNDLRDLKLTFSVWRAQTHTHTHTHCASLCSVTAVVMTSVALSCFHKTAKKTAAGTKKKRKSNPEPDLKPVTMPTTFQITWLDDPIDPKMIDKFANSRNATKSESLMFFTLWFSGYIQVFGCFVHVNRRRSNLPELKLNVTPQLEKQTTLSCRFIVS